MLPPPVAERPAPLVLVTTPADGQPFGSHAAIAADGQRLLAGELSQRLGRLGAAVAPLAPCGRATIASTGAAGSPSGARQAARGGATAAIDAIGYAGGGALALLADDALDALLSPIPGEVVANNRFSADAFVVAGDLDRALDALATASPTTPHRARLDEAGFASRDLGGAPWARFDVDTTLDLALLRLATRLSGMRPLDAAGSVATSRWPGCPATARSRCRTSTRSATWCATAAAELVVAGRMPGQPPGSTSRRRPPAGCAALVEERGMRSARGIGQPRARCSPRSCAAARRPSSSPSWPRWVTRWCSTRAC